MNRGPPAEHTMDDANNRRVDTRTIDDAHNGRVDTRTIEDVPLSDAGRDSSSGTIDSNTCMQ